MNNVERAHDELTKLKNVIDGCGHGIEINVVEKHTLAALKFLEREIENQKKINESLCSVTRRMRKECQDELHARKMMVQQTNKAVERAIERSVKNQAKEAHKVIDQLNVQRGK